MNHKGPFQIRGKVISKSNIFHSSKLAFLLEERNEKGKGELNKQKNILSTYIIDTWFIYMSLYVHTNNSWTHF